MAGNGRPCCGRLFYPETQASGQHVWLACMVPHPQPRHILYRFSKHPCNPRHIRHPATSAPHLTAIPPHRPPLHFTS